MDPIWSPLAEGQTPLIYVPGQLIYLQDTEPTAFYYLMEGSARSFISSPGGTERVLTIHRAGDLMGEASFFDGCPRVSSAMAVTRCKVVSVDSIRLERIFKRHPELAFPMLRYLSHTVRLLSSHVDDITFQSADRRLASALLRHIEGEKPLHVTHEDLGSFIGASRVTVSRILARFAKNGWVKTGYGTVSILDRPALETFVLQEP